LPELKKDLEDKKQALYLNEVLHLLKVLEDLRKIRQGPTILLRLIRHGSNIIQENSVDFVCLALGDLLRLLLILGLLLRSGGPVTGGPIRMIMCGLVLIL